MGCAFVYNNFSIGNDSDKFNGRLLKLTLEYCGWSIEDFAKKTGIRYDHWVEIIENLTEPTEGEIAIIMEFIPNFLRGFYYRETIELEEPQRIFMCGKGIVPCANCGQAADFLCDYPVGAGKTCDLPICNTCRTHVGKYDFCPVHIEISKVIRRI